MKTPVLTIAGADDQQAPPDQVEEQEAAFKAAGIATSLRIVRSEPSLRGGRGWLSGNYTKLPAPLRSSRTLYEVSTGWRNG